jgi:hypothetical protein
MSDWLRIALTALATIIGGVLVFVVTRIVERVLLDPVHEQRKVIGEIDVALTYWAWAYASPGLPTPDRERAVGEIRLLAGRLVGATNAIWWWPVASALLSAVRGGSSRQAGKYLIGISNQILTRPDLPGEGWGSHNSKSAARIRALLRIPSIEELEGANG